MLVLGKFDGGLTAASLASVLGTSRKNFRQFTLYADPANTGSLYFGASNVTGVPANEKLKLAAGLSINLGPKSGEWPFFIDTDALYVVGSAASQILYIIAQVDDGT